MHLESSEIDALGAFLGNSPPDASAIVRNSQIDVQVTIKSRKRNEGLSITRFDAIRFPAWLRLLADALEADEEAFHLLTESPSLSIVLARFGLSCRADELPPVVAFGAGASADTADRSLECQSVELAPLLDVTTVDAIRVDQRVPNGVAARLPAGSPIVWLKDPATSVKSPVGISTEELDALSSIRDAGVEATVLSAKLRESLLDKGILTSLGSSQRRRTSFAAEVDAGRSSLVTDGVAVLRELITGAALGALKRYANSLSETSHLVRLAKDDIDRRTIHDDPIFRLLHGELAQVIGSVVGSPLLPTYSLLARYSPGAVLPRHTDRPQCLWNVSLALDDGSTQGHTDAWPLYFETKTGIKSVLLGSGDAAIYSGTDTPHWRDALSPNRHATICFFHFVDPSFDGDLL